MRFKLRDGVRCFEAWTNQGSVRLDAKNPSLETDDPAEIEVLRASRHVQIDRGEPAKKAKAAKGAEA